jgi:hypothetical protein
MVGVLAMGLRATFESCRRMLSCSPTFEAFR